MDSDAYIGKKRVIWMMNCIQESFGLGDQENSVTEFFRKGDTSVHLQEFFAGNGRSKVLIYYQPLAVPDEYETGDTGENYMYITNGEIEALKKKAVYFLRRNPTAGELDLNTTSDGEVVFGEIHPNPLHQVKMLINTVFQPFVHGMDQNDWGECDDEQKKDFKNAYDKFDKEMMNGLTSLSESMENYTIDHAQIENCNESEKNSYYETLFAQWLDGLETILNDENGQKDEKKNKDAGPDTELIYWRKRLQSLTLSSELTKSNKDFCFVKNIVCSQKNKKGDDSASTLADRYRALDNSLTEKLNEAKDNVKYLVTLEKFIEPLKYGTPEEIIETLPALMNAIKMIHTIARYYKTSTKLTNLFVKITNQMITNCKNRILGIPPGQDNIDYLDLEGKIWDRDPEELIIILNSCIDLFHKYKSQYEATEAKSAEFPKSRHWDFDSSVIFGKFEKFIRRVRKLMDIFSVIQQFKALEKHNNLEGMDDLTSKFKQKITKFKGDAKNILDVEKMHFDKNFVDLMQNIQKLDDNLQGFIEKNFSKFKIISYSLKLLKKLKTILKSNTIRNRLESKYETILQNYGSEIEGIIKRFNEDRMSPPIIRNMPPDAGKIIWVRHLFMKLNGPIEEFPSNMITHKDMKRYVDKFNLVGKNLIVYELYFTQSWCNDIERAKACLQTPLLVLRDDNNQKYIKVNFEKDIQKLIREAKALDREGIGGIPESAKIILLQEEKFKTYYYELDFIKNEYERILGMIKPIMKSILSAHIEDLDLKLRPGMVTLTWTSMNIDGFIQHVQQALSKLEQLIITVNDIIDNRIENNLKLISKVILVMLPQDGKPMSLNSFVESQKMHIENQAELLMCKNIEIERAVDDLLQTIMKYPLDEHLSEGVDQKAAKTIKGYYFWYLYQALLNSTQNSLNAMKDRVCGKRSVGDRTELKPFFEVDVKLEQGNVTLDPSLDDIQKSINRAATAVLSCSKKLLRWDQLDQKEKLPREQKQSFYKIIAQDKEIVKVILLLTGSIEGTKNKVKEFKEKFRNFQWIWENPIQESLEKFTARNPELQGYEEELKRFSRCENDIDEIERTKKIGAMCFKTDLLNSGLKDKIKEWKTQYSKNLHNKAKGMLYDLTDNIKNLSQKLSKEVSDIKSLGMVMETIEDIRKKEAVVELEFNPVLDMYNLLDIYLPNLVTEREEVENRQLLRKKWNDLLQDSQDTQRNLQKGQTGHLYTLKQNIKQLVQDVKEFKKNFEDNGPKAKGISPKEASDRLTHFENDYELKKTFYDINLKGENLFGLQNQEYPDLIQIKSEIDYLSKLYELYNKVNASTVEWEEKTWPEIRMDTLADWESQIMKYSENCNKLPIGLKGWQAFKDLKHKIENYKNVLPFVKDLKQPFIKKRHWTQIVEYSGKDLKYEEEDNFYLKELIDADLLSFQEDLEDIIASAKKQKKIEKNKDEIRERWEQYKFKFKKWGARKVDILSGENIEEITNDLEEDIGTLAGLSAMKQVGPFKPEVQLWQRHLSEIESTLVLWIKVQVLWTSLEAVFSGGDIAKHLKAETKRFKKLDGDWKKRVMDRAVEQEKVKMCCQNDIIKSTLPDLQTELEACSKELEKYLEQKRKAFPRFYFVSDSVLLKFLSQGSEPENIKDDFDKLFDSVAGITFGKGNGEGKKSKKKEMSIIEVMDIVGGESEPIVLLDPVICKGNIEDWLTELEKRIQDTVKHKISRCYKNFVDIEASDKMDLPGMLEDTCAQIALMAIQMRWTKLIQDSLEKQQSGGNRGRALGAAKSEIKETLDDMTTSCKDRSLSKLKRLKLETIVTIMVYLEESIHKIKTRDPKSFEWQKFTRIYWKRSRRDKGDCLISITDWDIKHSYEYLGVQMRLCVTPLTDRCYISLAQAMSMHYGGAPAGPAGTGKTETVKDMGRTLGIFVIVTNCGPEQRYKDMAKIFKGLCQSGLWGCFDEFNRIELEVLSVVAMQVESITAAKKLGISHFKFPDEEKEVRLVMTCGYFITMNPGYAGRQELPENLKVLFRGVTMMVPDREIIIRVKLASSGYKKFDSLAGKFNILYSLCEQQLSKQKHYDFGLRNILSVLRTAGKTLRDEDGQEEDEPRLMKGTLADMNLSKLVAQDVPLFLDLLKDTFPGNPVQAKKYQIVEDAISKKIDLNQYTHHEPWIRKMVQVYESVSVRHGNMVIGPVGAGKSTLISVLADALSDTTGQKHLLHRMNPKSFTSNQMYGVKNFSGEWTDGIFSVIWERVNKKENKFVNWIVCDGPVDTIWIENLNTVLDDNKVLTLANGGRTFMRDTVKLWFEVENLNNASPATVSRCGQIYVSASDLGYEPVLEGWVRQRTNDKIVKTEVDDLTDMKPSIDELFTKNVGQEVLNILNRYFVKYRIIESIKKKMSKEIIELADVLRVTMTLNLLNGILHPILTKKNSKLTTEDYEKIILYSVIWGVGGTYENDGRIVVQDWFKEKGADIPKPRDSETIYDYELIRKSDGSFKWNRIDPPEWNPPKQINFSQILMPTIDSYRAETLIGYISHQPYSTISRKSSLIIGGPGTAKTSSVLMYASKFDPSKMLLHRINFSSATLPINFQTSIESVCEAKIQKGFGPKDFKQMTCFVDDFSMPEINEWGDQITLEILRQLMEDHGFYMIDKNYRGDFMFVENLRYVGAMLHPGGGRNDIPNRLKRQFFIFNMILPGRIDLIFNPILKQVFKEEEYSPEINSVIDHLAASTIDLWNTVKKNKKRTPSKFHYVFNLRDVSRIFKGICQIQKDTIKKVTAFKKGEMESDLFLIALWKHECERVFLDKLIDNKDKDDVLGYIQDCSIANFSHWESQINEHLIGKQIYFCDFLHEDLYDDDGTTLLEPAPKIYEGIQDMDRLKMRCMQLLGYFNASPKFQQKRMDLVLFDDALSHLIRISRIIQMDRSSALLVGVGGSGKQSLTRLAAFAGKHNISQIVLTKGYNENNLKEHIKELFDEAGHKGHKVTFIMTDSEVKDEIFLENINMVLSTGEIPGLLMKDEKEVWLGDVKTDYMKKHKIKEEPTQQFIYEYFVDRLRDNLHIVLCFSPIGTKFRERARKFPALFNECSIDWFLPWPQEALMSVSVQQISNFKGLKTSQKTREEDLPKWMSSLHINITEKCEEYYAKMRRTVFVTPKSYLFFLKAYKKLYSEKYEQLELAETNFKRGLKQIEEAKKDITILEEFLKKENEEIRIQKVELDKVVKILENKKNNAETKGAEVSAQKAKIELEAAEIQKSKAICEDELAKSLPALEAAEIAAKKINAQIMAAFKQYLTSSTTPLVVKYLTDVMNIILYQKVRNDYQIETGLKATKKDAHRYQFITDSWDIAKSSLSKPQLKDQLIKRALKGNEDLINDEILELIEPYTNLKDTFLSKKNVDTNAEVVGMIREWVIQIEEFSKNTRIVKPMKAAVKQQEEKLNKAMSDLKKAEERLNEITSEVEELGKGLKEKQDLADEKEEIAKSQKNKIKKATKLITSLSDEEKRWTEDAEELAILKEALVGNVGLATAFISYCGPFNSEFRDNIANELMIQELEKLSIPYSPTIYQKLTSFLVDEATVGQWNLDGLPKDNLSIQNGIMVESSDRYPLLIDPQVQGSTWLKTKFKNMFPDEEDRVNIITSMGHKKFPQTLIHCLTEGEVMIIEGIVSEVDPILDPILEKQYIVSKKGAKKIQMGEERVEVNSDFKLFLTCKLGNPKFSPELSAKTTIIDFTVTRNGLEQQLLSVVLSMEMKVLEDSLNALVRKVTERKKQLKILDDQLLHTLSNSKTNIIEDTKLVEILNKTKTEAKNIADQLTDSEAKTKEINLTREIYRPVAVRGSVMYFCLIEIAQVNWMYNSSLEQFLELYENSIICSERDPHDKIVRVKNIVEFLTYDVFRYVNRGLFTKDQTSFLLMMCFKILITGGVMKEADVGLFLKAGSVVDKKNSKPKPSAGWFPDNKAIWPNILALASHKFGNEGIPFFGYLPDSISSTNSTAEWQAFFEHPAPETCPIPEKENAINDNKELGGFLRFCLIRCCKPDRTIIAANNYIESILKSKYFIEPPPEETKDLLKYSSNDGPILFLLSAGADPTQSIDDLAREEKREIRKISLGEGQEPKARQHIEECMGPGYWVLLQNCHLGLGFMEELDTKLKDKEWTGKMHEKFRIWMSCEPQDEFPLGLLQRSLKVTNEPPIGMKAGLKRTFKTVINPEFIEKIENNTWKTLTYAICFLHSLVQERRKFGPLGWCIPYEFNYSDLEASLSFVEKYLNGLLGANQGMVLNQNPTIAYDVLRHMICEIQYGGRITDNLDRELFIAYGEKFLKEQLTSSGTGSGSGSDFYLVDGPVKGKDNKVYRYPIPEGSEHANFVAEIDNFPGIDSPRIFGLHSNADITFRLKETKEMIRTVTETRPKDLTGSSGKSRDEIVKDMCSEMIGKVNFSYPDDDIIQYIRELGGPKGYPSLKDIKDKKRGDTIPLNIFLKQELQRMHVIVTMVKKTFEDIGEAVNGQIIMTPQIVDSIDSIYDRRVPKIWLYDSGHAEISWLKPNFNLWFSSLIERNNKLQEWMKGTRPKFFNLDNFFNPQGFLTSMKQEVVRVRAYKETSGQGNEGKVSTWSLDSVDYKFHVYSKNKDIKDFESKDKADEGGVYIQGLMIEGADTAKDGMLTDASTTPGKSLINPMPIVHVTAKNIGGPATKNEEKKDNEYHCPVYKYPMRTDRYLIMRIPLKCTSQNQEASRWKLKGVAILASID